MRRRRVLTSIGVGSCLLAGCLTDSDPADGSGSTDRDDAGETGAAPSLEPPDYERCPVEVVGVTDLPGPARTEVETALDTGEYVTADRLFLEHVVDVERTSLRRLDDRYVYYDPGVENRDGKRRLTLDRTNPEASEALHVTNHADELATVSLRLERDDRTIVDHSFEVDAGDDVRLADDVDFRLGRNELYVETGSTSKRITWDIDQFGGEYRLDIHADRVEFGGPMTGVTPDACEWDEDGTVGPA